MPRILPISHVSYELWLGLWLAYSAGEIPVESELHALTSRRLCEGRNLHGVVAVADQPIGFAHCYFHPSTWAVSSPCHVQDLYVSTGAPVPKPDRHLGSFTLTAVVAVSAATGPRRSGQPLRRARR